MCHTGLTENQNRLLYLVSLYTHKAESHDDKDEWIRKPALLVLIYEGVVANVFCGVPGPFREHTPSS